MSAFGRKDALIIYLGDLGFLYMALWASFAVRSLSVPDDPLLFSYIQPFLILIAVWILVFYIAGLYDKHTLIFARKIPGVLLRTQLINTALAAAFFYLIPFYDIAPKTILFLFLFLSTFVLGLWRVYGVKYLLHGKKHTVLLLGDGSEIDEFLHQVESNSGWNLKIAKHISLATSNSPLAVSQEILEATKNKDIKTVITLLSHKDVNTILTPLYHVLFSKVRFLDFNKIYEAVFNREPLSLIDYRWFLSNVSPRAHFLYDTLKRIVDICFGLVLGVLSLPLYFLVYGAITLDDGGPLFIRQERVGQGNKIIYILKFRTMPGSGKNGHAAKGDSRVTRVGKFLRKTRVDELPQLWSVIGGDLSLIGPRPELPDLVSIYEREIPYYRIRHIIKPGLSGWAQINDYNVPRVTADIDKTSIKLAYDLYYLKNRSLTLDLEIILKTIKTMLSRSGV